MYYFDYLRVRKGLTIFTCIAGAVVLIQLLSLPFSHVSTGGDTTIGVSSDAIRMHTNNGIAMIREFAQRFRIPFGILSAIAGVLAILFATSCSTSLARQNAHVHFVLTKPVSRVRYALATVGIDAVAIAIALVVALALVMIPFVVIGIVDRLDVTAVSLYIVGMALGIAYMWYGILQCITVRLRGGAGVVVGVSWAAFGIFAGLNGLRAENFGEPVVWLIHAINTFNPIIYLGALFANAGIEKMGPGLVPGSLDGLWMVWAIAVAAIALAIVQRDRMEA